MARTLNAELEITNNYLAQHPRISPINFCGIDIRRT
jgi:hypothetical protein